jgi:hypothetical protein
MAEHIVEEKKILRFEKVQESKTVTPSGKI